MELDVSAPAVPARATVSAHDARTFWRVLLAIVVPLPWLAKGVQYIVMERSFDSSADQIRAWGADHTYGVLQWLDVVFVVLVLPSIVTMGWVSRRGAPRLATAAMLVMGGGFLLVLPLNMGADPLVWAAARGDFDPTTTGVFIDALAGDPRVAVGGLGFITAITIGSTLIGLALWRSLAVPAWTAGLVALGGLTHPFLSFDHRVHGAGLVALAVGCMAVSAHLLRLSNDHFDLPPRPAR